MDLLLGPPTDEPISVWDEMFIPMVMADELRSFDVVDEGGNARPLVLSDEVVVTSTRGEEPEQPPSWLWLQLLVGVTLGVLLAAPALVDVRERRVGRVVLAGAGTAWSLLGGVLGLILVGLLFTDHVFSYWNQNLFLANPLMLVTAVLIPLSGLGEAWTARARTWAAIVAGIALVGFVIHLLPLSGQASGMHFALALPGHLGLAWGLRGQSPHASRAGAAPELAGP